MMFSSVADPFLQQYQWNLWGGGGGEEGMKQKRRTIFNSYNRPRVRMRVTNEPHPPAAAPWHFRIPHHTQCEAGIWRPSLSFAITPTFVCSFSLPLEPRAGLSGLAHTAVWRRWPFLEPCAPPRRSTTFSRTRDRCRAKVSRKRRPNSCGSVS